MIPIIPYGHYYRVGGPPKLFRSKPLASDIAPLPQNLWTVPGCLFLVLPRDTRQMGMFGFSMGKDSKNCNHTLK